MKVWLAALVHASAQREPARLAIRDMLRAMAASSLGVDPALLQIASTPGSAPRLLIDRHPAPGGISIAHDGAHSLAAFSPQGPLGVDLMLVQAVDDWAVLARDYLGPQAFAQLQASDPAERPYAFASAWAAREASIKCLGLPLSEYTVLPQSVHLHGVPAPTGHVAMLASLTPISQVERFIR